MEEDKKGDLSNVGSSRRWFSKSQPRMKGDLNALISGTSLAGTFRLNDPIVSPADSLGVSSPQGFSGEQIRIGTSPLIVDSISNAHSNSKTEVAIWE